MYGKNEIGGHTIVVGAQWGDEGKGKIVDLLSEHHDVVIRYQGGANAGHTLVVDGRKTVLHLIPSGILHPGKLCVLGTGMVIDPLVLHSEIEKLRDAGVQVGPKNLRVSNRAHVILPHHITEDRDRETARGVNAIGTTVRGIGIAYEAKARRDGVRMADFVDEATELSRFLQPFVCDTSVLLDEHQRKGARFLLEGAQGTLIDLDWGTYPYVTSSSCVAGGACSGAGVGPTSIGAVVGVIKAYSTRVGNGPFPTELRGDMEEFLRTRGGEFGATTGRARRCGWLDFVGLQHAARANGFSGLAVTKLDVLSGLEEIAVCVRYELDGQAIKGVPARTEELNRCFPVYVWMPGWREDISTARCMDDLPQAARSYLEQIEEFVGVPVWYVSVGPDREQTIKTPSCPSWETMNEQRKVPTFV